MLVKRVKYLEDVVRFNYKGDAKSKIEFVYTMIEDTNNQIERYNSVGERVYLLERIELTDGEYLIRYRLVEDYGTDAEIKEGIDEVVNTEGYQLYRKEGITPVQNKDIGDYIRYIMGGEVGIEEIEDYKKTMIEIDKKIQKVKSLRQREQQNILLQELQTSIYQGEYWERIRKMLQVVADGEEGSIIESSSPLSQILQGNHWKLGVTIDNFKKEYRKVLLFNEYLDGTL